MPSKYEASFKCSSSTVTLQFSAWLILSSFCKENDSSVLILLLNFFFLARVKRFIATGLCQTIVKSGFNVLNFLVGEIL